MAERNESFRPLDGCKVAKLQIYRINDFLFKPGGLVYIGTCKLLLKTLTASRHHENGSQRTIPRLTLIRLELKPKMLASHSRIR